MTKRTYCLPGSSHASKAEVSAAPVAHRLQVLVHGGVPECWIAQADRPLYICTQVHVSVFVHMHAHMLPEVGFVHLCMAVAHGATSADAHGSQQSKYKSHRGHFPHLHLELDFHTVCMHMPMRMQPQPRCLHICPNLAIIITQTHPAKTAG